MQTKKALKDIYGAGDHSGFGTRLADIADRLVAQHEEREETRMAYAEAKEKLSGKLPFIAQVQRAMDTADQAALTDTKLPAIMRFDAYSIVREAARNNPGDRGLKVASVALQRAWDQDPHGHFTVGELSSYRDHFIREFPKSAIKRVFDTRVVTAGFQTLTNLPYLTRIASEVVDEDSYKKAMLAHGLAGDRPEQIRARAFIRGLVELNDEEAVPEMLGARKSAMEVLQAGISRFAQEMFEQQDETAGEPIQAPGEEVLPHDENSEEMAEINSPITGEPLVVELGVEEEGLGGSALETPEGLGDEPEVDEEASLPDMPEAQSRLSQLQPNELEGDDMPFETAEELEGAAGGETSTIVVDPTSGEELELVLRPVENDDGAGEDALPLPDALEDETDSELSPEDLSGVGTDERVASWLASEGYKVARKKKGSTEASKSVKPKKTAQLSAEQVRTVCAAEGITAESVESSLLDGDELGAGPWLVKVSAADEVELRRCNDASLSSARSTLVRSASIGNMDGVIGDFMALTAALLLDQAEENKSKFAVKTAAPVKPEVTSAYVITTDVPKGAPINARRMMAQVWRIAPEATGEMFDGRLSVIVPPTKERTINRISHVFRSVFASQNIEVQPLEMEAEDSPFNGQAPVQSVPAGSPMQPLQAPMQTSAVGTSVQQDFVQQHTDPLKQDKLAQLDDMAPEAPELGAEPGMEGIDSLGAEPGVGQGMPGAGPEMGAPGIDDEGMLTGGGGLHPEDKEAVAAAFNVMHNEGVGLLEAIAKFSSKFSAVLEKYGEPNTPQRLAAEREVFEIQQEEYSKPVVIPAKAAAVKEADLPLPGKIKSQHGPWVSVKNNWEEGELKTPKKVKQRPGKPQGTFSDKSMKGHGDSNSHPSSLSAKKPVQQRGKPHNRGEKFSPTDLGPDSSSQGDNATTRSWTQVSKNPKIRSTRKGQYEDSLVPGTERSDLDIVAAFDPEVGLFSLERAGTKIASNHEDLASALADAERRVLGTGGKVFIDDGYGNISEA